MDKADLCLLMSVIYSSQHVDAMGGFIMAIICICIAAFIKVINLQQKEGE